MPPHPFPVQYRISVDDADLWARLATEVGPVLQRIGLVCEAAVLRPVVNTVADDTLKLVFRDPRARPGAVLLCSRPAAPDLVARGVEKSVAAKQLLGNPLGRVILEPIASGNVDGLSYVLLPWRCSLSHVRYTWAIQRVMLLPHLLRWLRDVTQKTARTPDGNGACFVAALGHIASNLHMQAALRRLADCAIGRIQAGEWKPQHVLAHNDLWSGNLLLDSPTNWLMCVATGQFIVIDWAGALVSGYPLFDLLRLAQSLRVPGKAVAREVQSHMRILGG